MVCGGGQCGDEPLSHRAGWYEGFLSCVWCAGTCLLVIGGLACGSACVHEGAGVRITPPILRKAAFLGLAYESWLHLSPPPLG